ncbi:hypothetical protein GCM10011575_34880 [Microlunatus endophyticus]|uniref:Phage tail sheath protein n=1 Tax=Microlunatus endophyticus TaxID=1716077 RepID=A0A917W7P5_9ACTN|nr:hypothetical protein [Microlunatus endophyticus]GGL73572.1 hypothetical protein GCM10011575_34880 [Microlunatus endophyticus]
MSVKYIRVNAVANLFAPAVRAYGNVGIVGTVTPPTPAPTDLVDVAIPVVFTDPGEAQRRAPGSLGDAVAYAFAQSPGPTQVTAVRVDSAAPDWPAGLITLSTRDVQIVAVAGSPLNATSTATGGAVASLVDHVVGVSNTGGDGMERIGVVMLDKGVSDPTVVAGSLANERMVYVAHKSDQDVAAAVAGTIAGYQPHISMLLKPVAGVDSDLFTGAEIDQLNGSETFDSGPAGSGVVWLDDPPLIPGHGLYLGEGYTGNPGGKKYIDIVRTIDNVSFLLKAELIASIGNLRISRSGLRALRATMAAVLNPLVDQGVIEGYDLTIPILALLDRDPTSLTAEELDEINNAQSQRVVEVLASVDYAGAIHRLAIDLNFS